MSDPEQPKKRASWTFPMRPDVSAEEYIELKRSGVRRTISHFAVLFLFGGSAGLIAFLIVAGDVDHALQVFNTVLPIASGVIGYWFAEQKNGSKNKRQE